MFVIAGASGRTGGVVAETLLAQKQPVRVILRRDERADEWRRRGADVALAPLGDEERMKRALAGAAGLYVLLPEDVTVPNFHGARRRVADAVSSAVRASGIPHVVFLSTTAAFLPEGSGPAKDLHYAENALAAAGTTVSVIRACYFQENVLAALPAARSQGIYSNFLPSANAPFPTVATLDVGRVAASCLAEPPGRSEIVDLLGPAHSVAEMASELGRALGRELRVVDVPPASHLEALVGAGLPRQVAEALAEMFACVASGRIAPRGDRIVEASTPLRATVQRALGSEQGDG